MLAWYLRKVLVYATKKAVIQTYRYLRTMSLKLSTPGSFIAFPFSPYDIQLDLMRHLYSSIEDRKVTIVESPTGTGKTLSLLCSSLTWLKDEQSRARKGKLAALTTEDDVGPDWVLAQTLDRRRREMEMEEREYAERLTKARKKEEEMRRLAKGRVCKRSKLSTSNATLDRADCELDDEDATFLPDSDSKPDGSDDEGNISPAVRALMQKLQHGASVLSSPNGEQQEPVCTKIYYASRTHSQLSQVLHELRKLKLDLNMTVTVAPSPDEYPVVTSHPLKRSISMLSEDTPDLEDDNNDGACARTVSLGSRKQLCINESLRGKAGDLDEACRQMLGEKGKKRCPHLPPIDEETRMLDLRDQILATPKDIEDLLITGKAADTCPYFGSRRAIPQAQLVLLPYNLLLQKTAREALGIDLTDQVVVIDEAHNLISTLLSLSTTRLPLRTLSTARHQLSIYLGRFCTRLTTTHALHLKRLTGLLDALSRYAEEWQAQMSNAMKDGKTHGAGVERLGRKTEGVNLLEVESYLRSSKIARKISGYSVKALEKAAGQDATKLAKLARLSSTTPPLHAVESFITALTAASDDGRVTFSIVDNQVEIKYQHLNPSTYFQEVVDSARSVVLAGGTMSPISDITNQLFANLSIERLSTFSCGHIIPASNLQTLVLKKGPRGSDLLFKYEQRGDQALIAELGQILFNFANVVHAGIVVFLPSYAFLNTLASAWERSGVMEKLKAKKKVFLEPQDSVQTENVLREYAAVIHDSTAPCTIPGNAKAKKMNGALLFAVIGAKLSEGLNFTDDLARAVVIIGLPFANLASPELRERMNYVNRLDQRHRGPEKPAGGAKDAATELYENMCMNAVNQSIGRAIRHQGDWASLVLIDGRYASTRIRNKLPKWIGEGTVITDSFGQAMGELGRFHRDKRGL
ncbi:ATP-dependent RNA helicase CHL1 [Grifola frondosa]|uniref:ATP-dependent DNA helicase CHL1 n=1 Tax=Grifola frondosa TaxID=5627 RepID=A0A1C7M0G8_GRIFR|nr:ATP-dependent RNA helicase CHL1 [Grifola frondosa]